MICPNCGTPNSSDHRNCTKCSKELPAKQRGSTALTPSQRGNLLRAIVLAAICGTGAFGYARLVGRHLLNASQVTAIVSAGALAGLILGYLPGRAWQTIKLAYLATKGGLVNWLVSHRLTGTERRLEEQAQAEDPSTPHTAAKLALVYHLEGRSEEALEEMELAASLDGTDGVIRHNLGVTHAVDGHLARAAAEFQEAAAILDDPWVSYRNLAMVLENGGSYDQALEACLQAIERQPNNLELKNHQAMLLVGQGELEAAAKLLEEAISDRLDRRHRAGADINLGVIHSLQGQDHQARQHFLRAVQADPTNPTGHYNLGLSRMLGGQHTAAFEQFTEAIKCRPDFARAFCLRGLVCHQLGAAVQAVEEMKRATEIAPQDWELRYNLGTLYLEENHLDLAIRELERAYELHPKVARTVVNLGFISGLKGRLQNALEHFRLATVLEPFNPTAHYDLALAYQNLQMLSEAADHLQEALRIRQGFPEAENNLGVVMLAQGLTEPAVEHFVRANDLMSQSGGPLVNLGLAYYVQGDLDAAMPYLRQAVQLDPTLASARDLYGRVLRDRGDLPGAIAQWQELVKLEPANSEAYTNLGIAFYQSDQLPAAISAFKRALMLRSHLAESHNNLGLAYAKSKQMDEAVYHLGKVIEIQPNNPIVHSNYGLALYFKGETEKAVYEWMEVTRLSPAYARVREATRLSAYDDSEMMLKPVDSEKRMHLMPLLSEGFVHNFETVHPTEYLPQIPWPDIRRLATWLERKRRIERELMRLREI